MSTRLYVEGGGDRNPSKTKCRQAFRAFLLNAGLEGRLPRIFASGSRKRACDDFCHALGAARGDDIAVLLVDSESPVAMDVGPWRHLKDRDGWDKPAGADDDHVHLMVQCMEAWFLADRTALARYFGDGFRENSLSRRTDVEEVSKQDLERGLNNATRNSRPKGAYHKGRDSFAILADLPESGIAVTLEECEELGREEELDKWVMAARFAHQMLPQVFRPAHPAFEVRFAREHRLKLEALLESLPAEIFVATDALGWVYQFWQSRRKDEVNLSGDKIGADELPAVTQLFTEPYMVAFLLDNTLGAWWAGRRLTDDDLRVSSDEAELRRKAAVPGVPLEFLRFVRRRASAEGARRQSESADINSDGHVRAGVSDESLTPGDSSGVAVDASQGMRVQETEPGIWYPAAGSFDRWPEQSGELRILDPCCGSGHFLVAAFSMLVPMRMGLEGHSARDAVDAVLRENLHGLELDPRCVEVAAFALALAAWTYPGTGGYRLLPEMNLACSGLAPNATREQWSALSEQAAAAGGLAPGRDLFGVDDTLLSAPLRSSMDTLHELFEQAPVLGSLIDPHALEADLFQRDFESIRQLFAVVLEQERTSDDQIERAVAARGMARAAQLLSDRYTLVITNVPYLARGKQGQALRAFCERSYPLAKNDLATVFLERCLRLCTKGGTASLVLPQNWLFLTSYRKLRQRLLKTETWRVLARLGAGAFETVTGEVVKAILLTLSHEHPYSRSDGLIADNSVPSEMRGLDVSDFRTASEKAARLQDAETLSFAQTQQLRNPDARVTMELASSEALLEKYALAPNSMHGGDSLRFRLCFWEVAIGNAAWSRFHTPVDETTHYGGREHMFFWPDSSRIHYENPNAYVKGRAVWGRRGIAVRVMKELPATLYGGNLFDISCVPIVPKSPDHLLPIWCFCSSPEYNEAVRRIDQELNVTNATLAKVHFDLDRWTKVANERYPNGLPRPYSDDPTQWIFHGHPCGSVAWHETHKQTVHGPLRTDTTVLHIAVARLLGYRWPAEHDVDMDLADKQREWVRRTAALAEWIDQDGIVCIPSVRGEPPARDRLLSLLAAAFGDYWNDDVLPKLLANVDRNSLDDWLRDRFFDEHCKLFHHRPFVWHIWDGGRRDGFHALVSYHKLIEGGGKGSRLLESLTYSYLGDWITRQQDEVQRGEDGSDDRLAAALGLQGRLERFLEGEPPVDIFVRWKPINEQPIGWEPDINDGVRLNIRPFMAEDIPGGKKGAGVLRAKPKVAWKKDRGKEVLEPGKRSKPPWLQAEEEGADLNNDQELRPREDYPWFWTCPGDGPRTERTDFPGGSRFDGNRWNNLHYTNAMKSAAGEREWPTTRKPTRERRDDTHLAATDEQGAGGPSGRRP